MSELHAVAAERLAALGQRYTASRRSIVEALQKADRPVTIPQLLKLRRGLVQSSAYRNLAVLEQASIVHRIITTDEFARYELAEDLTEHHHHLICSSCGTVDDFVVPDDVEMSVEKALRKIAKRQGFTAAAHRLDVIGLCARCAA